ncbi:DUF305 domain-containing protein [Streptomyces sp. NPDC088261]|uniref:DUF305 domain-containing protein n=1 Tax=Streptomyces sp. NPDC088261 TaxID=3365851 RepID=UPI003806FF9E
MLIRRRNPRSRVAAVATAVVVAVLALGACDSGDDDASGASKSKGDKGLGVVAPGRPGEPAKTLSPDEALKAAPDDSPNSADFTYAQMMIVHHTQALKMTELVPKRAASTSVKRLAERIASAQKPEIDVMAGWLEINGGAKKTSGHDHGAMPGMATEAQLDQLRASKGKAFDELFLTLMITHHQGAITMATEALSSGNNVLVEEMAGDVIAQQTSEMARMRAL